MYILLLEVKFQLRIEYLLKRIQGGKSGSLEF
jgi:hypothetical protein